ncbi:omega-6 fatty acid desaturase (delta-12 desaturase) [Fusarium oxysporum f. sp. melonis 26406]|nr:omega-6 fatty acid desaturase (delta-12 desaturase) [Fusarium oxysporum f. sp. melonis 26406]
MGYDENQHATNGDQNVPREKAIYRHPVPDISTLRSAIPAHCFTPSTAKSVGYLLRDVALAASLAWLAFRSVPMLPSPILRGGAWIIYGFTQGLVGTGLWILAHEAGHGAFSASDRFNDLVGWVVHSILLVPYFSWKFSHQRHHMFTGHMDKDMAFVPETRVDHFDRLRAAFVDPDQWEDIPVIQFIRLLLHQLLAWPLYLCFNISAGKDSLQKPSKSRLRRSHFDAYSAVFRHSEALYIILSDIGIGLTIAILYIFSAKHGMSNLMLLYGQPYLWVHHWLIAITYLHHTHEDVPHYTANGWTFTKGALATIDRDFGFIGRVFFHGIIDRHVVHHLFP